MSSVAEPHAFARIRAPGEDKTALIEPPLASAAELVRQNRRRLAAAELHFHGVPLTEVARQARRDLISAAWHYSREYRDLSRPPTSPGSAEAGDKIILCGHQPELFHPGVWFKNFVLHRLAAEEGAYGIHLLIDNDVFDSPYVSVVTGAPHQPRRCAVPLDASADPMPFEERQVRDPRIFAQFGTAVARAVAPLVGDPTIRRLWPYALAARQQWHNLGQCVSQARHRLEADWGLNTLELPLSRVCDTPGFQQFATHVCATLPEFREGYNRAVLDYRAQHHLRSESHPVPLLGTEDEWLEAPFWGWTHADPQRRAVMVRHRPDGWQLRLAGHAGLPPLPGPRQQGADLGDRLASRGIKLRPRALMTTIYARLCLSDLFVHGIGGAKYDQVTDAIIQRVFHLQPPAYMAVSATLRLPVPAAVTPADDLHRLDAQLRELWYHPELAPTAQIMDGASRATFLRLCQEKQHHLAARPTGGSRRDWHHRLEAIQEALRQIVNPHRQCVLRQRAEAVEAVRRSELLSSREYSFCIFPDKDLRQSLLSLSGHAPYATGGTDE